MIFESPSVVAGHGRAALLTADGELIVAGCEEIARRLEGLPPPLLVHRPATLRRLGKKPVACYDLLELFAFVMPARSATPTPRGLALALGLDASDGIEAAAASLPDIATVLLRRLSAGRDLPMNRDAAGLAVHMGKAGWSWGDVVAAALGQPKAAANPAALMSWRVLPEWEHTAPPPPPAANPVAPAEARTRLAAILGPNAEQRAGQADYAGAITPAFDPRRARGDPSVVIAEAGTGTGKTLGYIAPASLWAERNRGAVWISTYTRLLQRQIFDELSRLYPDPAERRRKVVVRKGRENYLCLLKLEAMVNASRRGTASPAGVVPLGLVSRWVMATEDGDIQGGDLPGWFSELFGSGASLGLGDRRGECIFGACAHYKKCFVEHTVRRARTADLVIANHALVMAQAAWGGLDDANVPVRYVFDEGHHVFDAADSAFAADLSGVEAGELRRWLLGNEDSRSIGRGLRGRLSDLTGTSPTLPELLNLVLAAARVLPGPGWPIRLGETTLPELDAAVPGRRNPTEIFLRAVRDQVLARATAETGVAARESLEVDLFPASPELIDAASRLAVAFAELHERLKALRATLAARLEDEVDDLDEVTRSQIEAVCRTLGRRAIDPLSAWRAMLRDVGQPPPDPETRPTHVMLLRLERRDGSDRDTGLCRHWLDPTVPFATVLAAPAHGLLITSATLRDSGEGDAETTWAAAEARVGALHLPSPAIRAAVASPFDYAEQTRAFVVTDVVVGDMGALAGAYLALFKAAGGGGLGLFTAISRLVAVHRKIAPALEEAGIPLLAQHVDAMDNATLVDVFRTEEASCLLGTDAMRDGVDVPGRSLRLVAFERVPWPRPDILHRERRVHLSGGDPTGFDDRSARLRLRQAFGRLIRTTTDRGVFVLLDRRTPTRLLSAFPQGVTVRRVGLAEAVAETRAFLAESVQPATTDWT